MALMKDDVSSEEEMNELVQNATDRELSVIGAIGQNIHIGDLSRKGI